jgi:hypothetical protein
LCASLSIRRTAPRRCASLGDWLRWPALAATDARKPEQSGGPNAPTWCGSMQANARGGGDRSGDRLRSEAFYASHFRYLREVLGGGGGIRTHGAVASTPVFETGPIDHSGTPPRRRGSYTSPPPSATVPGGSQPMRRRSASRVRLISAIARMMSLLRCRRSPRKSWASPARCSLSVRPAAARGEAVARATTAPSRASTPGRSWRSGHGLASGLPGLRTARCPAMLGSNQNRSSL